MTKVNEQRIKLRIEYSRETDLIFSDNIPAYADWLEKKLALRQPSVVGCVCPNEIKTGTVSINCCNICGKRDEEWWGKY